MNFSPTEIEHGTDETPEGSTNQNGKSLSIEEFMVGRPDSQSNIPETEGR